MLKTEADRERIYERLPIPLQTVALSTYHPGVSDNIID